MRHSFEAALKYEIPRLHAGMVGATLRHWSVASIFMARTCMMQPLREDGELIPRPLSYPSKRSKARWEAMHFADSHFLSWMYP